MQKIISVINQKGGVGKTATVVNLAYNLAEQGKRTLLIDLDPSANASSIFDDARTISHTAKEFLLSDINDVSSFICSNIKQLNLTLIPSHIRLAMADRELANKPFRELILSKRLGLDYFKSNFDYVLIDCPPTLSTLTINAMYASTFILIPVTYAKDALEGIADLFEMLSEIKEGHTYDIRILRNQYDGRKKVANNFVGEKLMTLITQGYVLNSIIRQDESVNRASINNETVMTYSPTSEAAQDYRALTTELQELFNYV